MPWPISSWWKRTAKPLDMGQFTPHPEAGYLVGGAVRDALLGRETKDIDWIVINPEAEAERAASVLGGRAFVLDTARNHWRVVSSGLTRDYTPLGDSHTFRTNPETGLETNLRARDYTVNAVAADLEGTLHDPTEGLADLRAQRLRFVSEANLWADPVRGLRGVRLAAVLGFALEADTLGAISAHAAALQTGETPLPAWERVNDELTQLLLSERAAAGMQLLQQTGLLHVFLPELALTDGITQGGFHHLDVLQHSFEALNQLTQGFPDADLTLRWATLLHDLGKPATKAYGEDGVQYHFYGHDKRGAELAQTLLARLRVAGERRERAAQLIRYHMLPLPKTDQEARRFVHRRRTLLPDLLKLMIADREAARGPQTTAASRRAYRLALARILAIMSEAPPRAPLLDGHEVMQLLGIAAGPRVGEAVRFVQEAEAVGDVRNKEEAETALRHYAAVQGWLHQKA